MEVLIAHLTFAAMALVWFLAGAAWASAYWSGRRDRERKADK